MTGPNDKQRQREMTQVTIGVDISKDALDIYRLPDGQSRRFSNDAAGHHALIAFIGKSADLVVFEPTGPYHRAFEAALAKKGLAFVKVNPRQARRFAEATGKLAKTDRIDAANLARMGAVLNLPPRDPRPEILNEIKELYVAREALVKDRTAAKNREKQLTLPLLKRQADQRLAQIERQITAIEAEIRARLAADPALARRLEILTSIPSVSNITAFALIIEMPELGTLNGKQAASLAGLAPVARQSGRWTGRAIISGGRANVRRALYMPALVATRFNKNLKAKYEQLTKAGKPAKVAITAIMRKLIVLANALLREDRCWVQKPA
jgi:transposase